MEIIRFGPGHRRPEGPPGTHGLTGQVIWNDDAGTISELAFSRRALISPHANPNTTLFIVVSGAGHVQVGEEQVPINHGEAVVWPPDVIHAAWTDGTEMRAIVVELPDVAAAQARILEGEATRVVSTPDAAGSSEAIPVSPARGSLAERPILKADHDEAEGEPW
jgi:quercetin dioxygenase-like cupin family protein